MAPLTRADLRIASRDAGLLGAIVGDEIRKAVVVDGFEMASIQLGVGESIMRALKAQDAWEARRGPERMESASGKIR